MKPTINQKAVNSAAKVLANQIKTLEAQGYEEMYFTAQFYCNGKRQNCIERGDVTKISKQIRDYVKSEEADTMNVEVIEEATQKSVYRKKFFSLYENVQQQQPEPERQPSGGLGGYGGLGEAEVRDLVNKQVIEARKEDEFIRLNREVDELRGKANALEEANRELDETLKAKKDTEYYMSIIGAAFPGLATLFTGTPLAQAAGFLAGTSDLGGNAIQTTAPKLTDEVSSISAMVAEFCNGLTTQEASAIHLLFMSFETDRTNIQRALQFITAGKAAA